MFSEILRVLTYKNITLFLRLHQNIASFMIVFVLVYAVSYIMVKKTERNVSLSEVGLTRYGRNSDPNTSYLIGHIPLVFIGYFAILYNVVMPFLLNALSFPSIYLLKVIGAVVMFFISKPVTPWGYKPGRLLISLYILLPYSGAFIQWIQHPTALLTAPILVFSWLIARINSRRIAKEKKDKKRKEEKDRRDREKESERKNEKEKLGRGARAIEERKSLIERKREKN